MHIYINTGKTEKILNYKENYKILPGHGEHTFLKDEQEHLPTWLRYF